MSDKITDAEALALWLGTKGDDGRYTGGKSFKFVKEQMTSGDRTARFEKLAGGKDAMKALRALGAGGGLFGGKGGPRAPAEPIDDSKVPVITEAPVKKGWRVRTLYPSRDDIIVDPKGTEYVWAKDNERADLIYKGKLGICRMRLLENSSLGRKNKRLAKVDVKAIAHLAKKKKAKKERRARKAAKIKSLTLAPEPKQEESDDS